MKKSVAPRTIDRMNVSFHRLVAEGLTPRQAGDKVAMHYRSMTLIEIDGNDFDGVALYRSQRGGYATCWFGSDYSDQGFDANFDIFSQEV